MNKSESHRHSVKISRAPNEPEHRWVLQKSHVEDELVEAFQVCEEFDRRFERLRKDDSVLEMKLIDCGGDMNRIQLDEKEVDRVVGNEERPFAKGQDD